MAEWVYAGLVGLLFAAAGVLLPEPWLPWVLIGAGALLAWTATEAVYKASTRWTRPSRIKNVLAWISTERNSANIALKSLLAKGFI